MAHCPYCGEQINSDLHYCQDKASMIVVTWEMIKKFGCWVTRCNRGKKPEVEEHKLEP